MDAPIDSHAIESALLALLDARGDASICPSEVARALAPHDESAWRALMPAVRNVAVHLAQAGEVVISRKGIALAPDALGAGPIRITRARR